MNKIIPFFNLIRFKNLVIIALTQSLIKYTLINPFEINSILSNFHFFLLVLTTILITAAGYIINDIYDVEADRINKNENLIIDKYINTKQAMWWYLTFNIIALLIGLWLSIYINIPLFSLIFIFSIYSLWIYSKRFKKSILIGNIQISLLTTLSILNVALFDIIPNGIIVDSQEWIIFNIITYYCCFAAIITLVREIIKDIEDMQGDLVINAKTFIISYGMKNTKKLTISLTLIIILCIAYFQYLQLETGGHQIAILYTLFIQCLFVFLCLRIYQATHKRDFSLISKLCKVIMIFGIFSIPLFTYVHLN